MKMNDWQKDLLEERRELAARIAFYTNAMVKDKLLDMPFYNATALFTQLGHMLEYHKVLVKRISRFSKDPSLDLNERIASYTD
jgi:hypothetical protein